MKTHDTIDRPLYDPFTTPLAGRLASFADLALNNFSKAVGKKWQACVACPRYGFRMTTVRSLANTEVRPELPVFHRKAADAATRRLGCIQRAVARWHAVINSLVPIGYEDASGFHYGEPASGDERSEAIAS